MDQINLLSEVSKVIYQIFMALKHTSKIMHETTYTWKQFSRIVEDIMKNIVSKAKIDKAGRASAMSKTDSADSEHTRMQRK